MDDVYQPTDAKADASINPVMKHFGYDVGDNDYDDGQNDLVFVVQLHGNTHLPFNSIVSY